MCLSDNSLFHKWHAFMNIVNGAHLTIIHRISMPTLLHYGQSISCWAREFKSLACSSSCKVVFNLEVLNENTGFLRNIFLHISIFCSFFFNFHKKITYINVSKVSENVDC